MPELQRLRADHAAALLVFERDNREYFAASVRDRGDDYFADFDRRHHDLLAEQDDGTIQFHVLVDQDGTVVGRINLVDIEDGTAELGYRIAERAAGRGLATAGVLEMCTMATTTYGLTLLRASTTTDNFGSRAVLARTGFEQVGDADFDGRPGLTYARTL